MGSTALLESSPPNADPIPPPQPPGIAKKGRKRSPVVAADNEMGNDKKDRKQTSSQSNEEVAGTRKRPKRAAACSQLKENSEWLDDDSCLIEVKQSQVVQDEALAIRLTDRHEDAGQGFPRRRLTNFSVYDGDGAPLPLEMIEDDKNKVFISGVILPLEEQHGKEKDCRVECRGFGRVTDCKISGYKEGIPVIWLTTEVAEYNCMKPLSSYKMFYNHFFEKACACVEAYKKLSKSSGGNPELTLDELLAQTVRSMKASMPLCSAYVKDFIVSQGEFIYKQLEDLDRTQMMNDQKFIDLPSVIALLEESHNHGGGYPGFYPSNSSIRITEGDKEEDKDTKSARLWQEVEYWNSVRGQKKNHVLGPSSKAVYIKINEDEIANDYPFPAFYKHNDEEIDEYILFAGDDVVHPDDLPKRMLHNWSLYNSDSRFISLELLPMKPCEAIDVTIFGSGYMTEDDGSGFCLDNDAEQSSTWGSSEKDFSGLPIFLSDIKEWVIEFGPSMIFVSVRTDMAWYRLGKPSKHYAPWYKPVLKTAKLALSIITWLKEQSRVSKLSFTDVMKKVSGVEKDHPAFISSDSSVTERYVTVHGQIIRQLFAEFPDKKIKSCAFLLGLMKMMEQRHHTKWIVKKRDFLHKGQSNLNPRAGMCPGPALSTRKAMQATTTRLVNRIWGEFYSNYSPEDLKEGKETALEEVDEVEEPEENEEDDEEETQLVLEKVQEPSSASGRSRSQSFKKDIRWDGNPVSKLSSGENIYRQAIVHGQTISVGSSILLEGNDSELPIICYVEYMHEASDGSKLCHVRIMQRGCQTVVGNASNEREVFLTNECMDIELQDIKQAVKVEIRKVFGGHQYRKDQAVADRIDRERGEERKKKGLPLEYYCKSLYWPERGAFFSLPYDTLGVGSGICYSCTRKQTEKEKECFKLFSSSAGFIYNGTDYYIHDFVYLDPHHFAEEMQVNQTFKGGRNVGSKAYVIGQLMEINVSKELELAGIEATTVKVRRFFRPEDISSEKAYCSDIREIYFSEETHVLPIVMIEGKCDVRRRCDIPPCTAPAIFDHVFFCENLYDPSNGALKQLPTNVKLRYSTMGGGNDAASRKRKGKRKEGETDIEENKEKEVSQRNCLDTLDIFAGCGGLSEGLQQAGVASTKWSIEYEEPAGEAFKLNHSESLVFVNNCNVILRAVMEKCGDLEDCISTPEAAELAASLDGKMIKDLPQPGQVEFINGGPPCQGFSGMNRFNQGTWSKVQCEMILAFLSFADYFRPKYFLLENVRTFVSFNKGQTFRLTLASLLEMGYQVRFGILEAGTFGIAQSRKRAFIWAAAPEEVLPEWPEPMHVFAVPELKIALTGNSHYSAVPSTASGAPFRAITVRDTIGDLPIVKNGASNSKMEYTADPVSWFQKKIRGNSNLLVDHISKEMNELNVIRCQKIPRRPGSDWRDLPDEKIKLSTGQLVDLVPWCLPNTAKRHNQWKGLFGRLDWEGNFPTSITDPQPMGKVGMCFHPEQDRIVTVRECARSQGFPDSYQFSGTIQHKHRQIGNAVPPPLAYALGVKLKEALTRDQEEVLNSEKKKSKLLPGY